MKECKPLTVPCYPCPTCNRISHPDNLIALWDGATPGSGVVCEACAIEYSESEISDYQLNSTMCGRQLDK